MTLKRKKLPHFLAWFLTFFFILVTRVLFDANGMTQAIGVYRTMFDLTPAFEGVKAFLNMGITYIRENLLVTGLILAGGGICFFAPNANEMFSDMKPRWYHAVFSGILITVS
jgi:hypothetical protein